MDPERRIADRYTFVFPMKLDANAEGPQALAVSRNMSTSGVCMVTAAALEIGSEVELHIKLAPGQPDERTVQGTIVRVGENELDPKGLWPQLVAVRFAEDLSEIEPQLRELAEAD